MNKLHLEINSELHIVAEGLTDDQMITIRTLLESFAIKNHDDKLLDSVQDVFNKSGAKETEYLNSIPGMTESILKGAATPIEECIPEESVDLGSTKAPIPEGDTLVAPSHTGGVRASSTSVSLETPSTELMSDPMTDQLVLGKMGKKYIFNHAKVEDLFINQNKNQSQLASMAGVNVLTMRKYLDESGLLAKKKGVIH